MQGRRRQGALTKKITHLFVKFRVQPVLNRPRYDETVGRVLGFIVPTLAFDLLNVGTYGKASCEELIWMSLSQEGHEIVHRIGRCVDLSEGGVSLAKDGFVPAEKNRRFGPVLVPVDLLPPAVIVYVLDITGGLVVSV